jgi:PadR family transcriptional regulator PadR
MPESRFGISLAPISSRADFETRQTQSPKELLTGDGLYILGLTSLLYICRVYRVPEDVRLSAQTLAVLQSLLRTPLEWRYGYDLSQETALKSGTLYPILIRLTERGWLESRWYQPDEQTKPRHMYRLTKGGLRAALSAVRSRSRSALLRPAHQES